MVWQKRTDNVKTVSLTTSDHLWVTADDTRTSGTSANDLDEAILMTSLGRSPLRLFPGSLRGRPAAFN